MWPALCSVACGLCGLPMVLWVWPVGSLVVWHAHGALDVLCGLQVHWVCGLPMVLWVWPAGSLAVWPAHGTLVVACRFAGCVACPWCPGSALCQLSSEDCPAGQIG